MSWASAPFVNLAGLGVSRTVVNATMRTLARRSRIPRRNESVAIQARQLRSLLQHARRTRFGRDHGFDRILRAAKVPDALVREYQRAVPFRSYEQLWDDYLGDAYPCCRDLTWPGLIPYYALTSGTTQGATKYIPVSRAMLASNRSAAWSMVLAFIKARPHSKLFHGRMFVLGGSTDLEEPAPGVRQGDLSAIAALEVSELLRPYTFPPIDLALESDWERKLDRLVERSIDEPITLISGVPSWLLIFFRRLLDRSGRASVSEVWPTLEVVVHGGVKFDPYRSAFEAILGSPSIATRDVYPCSEGFIGFEDADRGLLRPVVHHGIFYEFVPIGELGAERPTRHWFGTIEPGINYAIVVSTCAGLWSHVIGDTIRFESCDPPRFRFTGRTKYALSAFGEHLINEEVELAMATAAHASGAQVNDWHAGPVFEGDLGHHLFLVEFATPPSKLEDFRDCLDAELADRNADYRAHRVEGVGLPLPAVRAIAPGSFALWMKSRGKFGGQHKVPRMDDSGKLTSELATYMDHHRLVSDSIEAGRGGR